MEQESTLSISQELEEVRKAHRLIHSFQERMISIIKFIQTRLDFPDFYGYKQFSNPIKIYKQGEHQNYMKIYPDMWAWDFMYSYVFEYYLGEGSFENGGDFALSIIQYADTGYFENENDEKNNPLSYAPIDESTSKLLFILEFKPKKVKTWVWNINELCMTKEFASKEHTNTVIEHPKGNKQLLYSIPLEKFTDEKSALNALRQFAEYCCQNAGFDMEDFNLD